jgi:hypothetical protein
MKQNTLKLKGSLKGKYITILVDSGSTHNFVDINLTRQLNLFVYLVNDLTVTIVDGQPIRGVGRCHKVSINIQNLELQAGYYALSLCGIDMVLGAECPMQRGMYATNL